MRTVNTCGAGLQLECRKSSSSAISQRQCREDLYNNTIGDNDWSSVSAVKNEQVYKIAAWCLQKLVRQVHASYDAYVACQRPVYPDQCVEDVDMTEEVENYYKEVYNIELTDDQVAQMYTPSADAANGYGSSK